MQGKLKGQSATEAVRTRELAECGLRVSNLGTRTREGITAKSWILVKEKVTLHPGTDHPPAESNVQAGRGGSWDGNVSRNTQGLLFSCLKTPEPAA